MNFLELAVTMTALAGSVAAGWALMRLKAYLLRRSENM